MSIDMVKYYFKDLNTGVEVTFSKTEQWGWGASFHVSKEERVESILDMLISDIKLPWPELSEEEQRVVDKNYEDLRERMK